MADYLDYLVGGLALSVLHDDLVNLQQSAPHPPSIVPASAYAPDDMAQHDAEHELHVLAGRKFECGDLPGALADLNRLLQQNPSPGYLYRRALCLYYQRNWQAAAADLAGVLLSELPLGYRVDAAVKHWVARIRLGERKRAYHQLNRAEFVAPSPEFGDCLREDARFLLGLLPEAEYLVDPPLRATSSRPRSAADTEQLTGWFRIRRGFLAAMKQVDAGNFEAAIALLVPCCEDYGLEGEGYLSQQMAIEELKMLWQREIELHRPEHMSATNAERTEQSPERGDPATRLRALQQLLDEQLISPEEFELQRRAIIAGV